MLLNLSNHPSKIWSPSQLAAAQEAYDSVVDWAFPPISPQATTQEVADLAKSYLKQIMTAYPNLTTVHLMGEMTFTATLVRLLQKKGISVISSTTERIVLEEKDGKKTAQFLFCQFRTYPFLKKTT
ncbi:MAG: hypothetical protein RL329_4107, partial [Bacteroidota bacterium]|jgi:hypothetical protein